MAMSTNLYGIILWQKETYLVTYLFDLIHTSGLVLTSCRYGLVLLSCNALSSSFNTLAFANLIAFVGTDLFKELLGYGSCSSCSCVTDSDFTGKRL